jgi:hemimethylated DNA binding protein
MSHSYIVKTVFRSLLRSSRRLESAGRASGLSPSQILSFVAGSPETQSSVGASLPRFISASFTPSLRSLTAQGAASALDASLAALRRLNQLLALPPSLLSALVRGRPNNLSFTVGAVVRHKESGYRGVVTGWTSECQAGAHFRARNGILPDSGQEPFYTVAVDTRDRAEPQVTYVAQSLLTREVDNMEGVMNPLLPLHFLGFKATLEGGVTYIPGEALSTLFPLDSLLVPQQIVEYRDGCGEDPAHPQSVKTLG